MPEHPLLDRAFLVRWNDLDIGGVAPAVRTALASAQAAIDTLAAPVSGTPTYDDTLGAFERATEVLNEAWSRLEHLLSVQDSPELRAAHAEVLPEVTAFYSSLPLNEGLWNRLQAFAATPEAAALDPVRRRFLDETLEDFRQYGAGLPADRKARLQEIDARLAAITQKYSEQSLDSRNAFELVVDDPARLAGLPESARAAALADARRKGLGSDEAPRWRFTLQTPSIVPVLQYADDDALRRSLWEANVAVASTPPHDNLPLVREVVGLRAEKAALLGRPNFPDLVLSRRMAKTGAHALGFVTGLHARVYPRFRDDNAELEEYRARATGQPRARLAPWEIPYWAEKLRRERFDFDPEQLRPYFALPRVVDGLFDIARRLFGVTAVPRADAPVWHPEVRVFDLRDEDGRHLGSFYTDWHPREEKRGGAWMASLRTGGPRPDGGFDPHLGLVTGNLTRPLGDRPALLRHDEVITIFHEFGHLLHHLLGNVAVRSLSGTNVAWDFVELPSQILENWCWERESLDLFARHVDTGEPIPDALLERMRAARRFRTAAATVRQLYFGRMDLEIHLRQPTFLDGDVDATLRELLADYLVPASVPSPAPIRNFGHLFSSPVGYAAGYYSYKWAEVLDADAFSRFQKEGLLNPRTGRAFRGSVLARGNSADPAQLFREFMGRDPDPEALLRRDGFA